MSKSHKLLQVNSRGLNLHLVQKFSPNTTENLKATREIVSMYSATDRSEKVLWGKETNKWIKRCNALSKMITSLLILRIKLVVTHLLMVRLRAWKVSRLKAHKIHQYWSQMTKKVPNHQYTDLKSIRNTILKTEKILK